MKKILANINYPLLILMIIYSAFGLLMIFSASSVAAVLRYDYSTNHFFVRQLIWTIFGYAAGLVVLIIPTKYYRFISKIAMYGTIALLALIFVAGKVAGGAQSWYDLGKFNFQPVEFAKIVLIVYLAVYFHKIASRNKTCLMDFLYPLILAVIVFVLVALQPDFGGAFIIFLITALIFFSIPFGKKQKKLIIKIGVVGVVIVLISLMALGKNIFQSYQVSRILNFTNPCQRYSDDSGYQVCNGYIAIHNGGLWGVGLGNSTQKFLYLPEAHTDFIFPIICEELGLVAGIIVVIGYFIMFFILLNIAKETGTIRDSILVYGIFVYLLAHILINLLGVLGLIPLTGVPLPFLSYGGSYNLSLIVALFIVQRVNYENKDYKIKNKIRAM